MIDLILSGGSQTVVIILAFLGVGKLWFSYSRKKNKQIKENREQLEDALNRQRDYQNKVTESEQIKKTSDNSHDILS